MMPSAPPGTGGGPDRGASHSTAGGSGGGGGDAGKPMAWEPAGPRVRELDLLSRSVPVPARHSLAPGLGARRFSAAPVPAAGRGSRVWAASRFILSADGQLRVTSPPTAKSPHRSHRPVVRAALEEPLLGKTLSALPSPCSGPPRGDTGWPGKGGTATPVTSGSATYPPEHSICLGHAILRICPKVDFSWFSGPSG